MDVTSVCKLGHPFHHCPCRHFPLLKKSVALRPTLCYQRHLLCAGAGPAAESQGFVM